MDKKWQIVLAAVGIHISIGAVYAWSVFTNPIMSYMGASLKEVQFTFSIAILFLGFSASFLGKYVERYGSKKSGLAAAAFYGAGMLGAGLAIYLKSLWLLYIFYGMIGGIGLGIGYITPVSTLVKWFPKKRGLATGFAIMGFGFAAMAAGPIIQKLMTVLPLYLVPVVMGLCYIVLMTISSLQFALPPAVKTQTAGKNYFTSGMTAPEALKTWQFKALWLILFINIFCGIAIISIASPLAQEFIGMNAAEAAVMVGVMGLFNGAGRILWSALSDYIGRPTTYMLFFLLQIAAFYALTTTTAPFLFTSLIYLIMTCYGGGFSAMPAYLSDVFGIKALSTIHGHILTAWGLAGLFAPLFTAWIKEMTNGYGQVLFIFTAFYFIALSVALALFRERRLNKARTLRAAS